MNRNNKGQFVKGHSLGVRFGSGQSTGSKEKYKKISLAQKGKKLSSDHIEKLRISHIGQKAWNKGTKGVIKANSGSFTRDKVIGEKNVNWNGGTSFEPYSPEFNKILKEEIRKRDGYKCRECGYSQDELGYSLTIHHIDYNKKNSNPDNLISLCRGCHSQTLYKRNDWTSYFKRKTDAYEGYLVGSK